MKRIAIACLLLVACSTGYHPMGIGGGYQEESMGSGMYLITVKVNGYTGGSAVTEYLYRRAKELCPDGFMAGNQDTTNNYSTMKIGNSVQLMNKPEGTMLVQCKADLPPKLAASKPFVSAMPQPRDEAAHRLDNWWCVTDVAFGKCFRDQNECITQNANALTKGFVGAASSCQPMPEATCLTYRFTTKTDVVSDCYLSRPICLVDHDFVTTQTDYQVSDVTTCEVRE